MKMRTAVIGVFLAGCLLATGCVHHHHHSQPVVVEPATTTTGGPVGADPAVDMFYNDLAPYGEWVYVDGPGWVWSPYGVEADWRPYQYGHWVYTDYGWTWASDEEFGWAVYHYGRWHQAPRYGWVWVPGTDWGPAWVAWHESDDWVGWAPLPYHVRWRAGVGLDWGHSSVQVAIQSGQWSFVAARYLVDPHVDRHIAPRSHNTTYIRVTKHVTNYTYIDNRVINRSVQVNKIGRAVGHPVRTHRVRQADHPGQTRGGQDDGDDLVIYRPREHPGREPQRRPVPPGQADEHRGKKNRQGTDKGRGRNDRDERPAADRPDRDRDNERADRPAAGRREPKRADPDRTDRKQSDQRREETLRDTRPSGRSQRPTKPVPIDEAAGNRKSGQGKPESLKAMQGDAKRGSSDATQPGSQPSKSSRSKGKKSKDDSAKDGKSKQHDPETEDENSGRKGSKKRAS